MYLKSLNCDIGKRTIITDIDDCLIFTTKSIKRYKLRIREFWCNPLVYKRNKVKVFNNAQKTQWGIEFKKLIDSGFDNYILLTAAKSRKEIIAKVFNVDPNKIIEACEDDDKINFLKEFKSDFVYVDDKTYVIKALSDKLCVNYPNKKSTN